MKLYQTKPKVVKAVQITDENIDDIKKEFDNIKKFTANEQFLLVQTQEGKARATKGCWIVKNKSNEFSVFSGKEFKEKFDKYDSK